MIFVINDFTVSTAVWKTTGKVLFYDVPVGQMVLVAATLARFRGLLMMHALSYALLLFNIELNKGRGVDGAADD